MTILNATYNNFFKFQPHLRQSLLVIAALLLSVFSGASIANAGKTLPKLEAKTIAPVNFFYGEYTLSGKDMHQQGEKLAEKTAYAVATKTHAVIDGPFTYRFEHVESLEPKSLTAQIGWPVSKPIPSAAGYLFKQAPSFKAVTRRYEGMHTGMVNAWKKLVTEAIAQGFKPTGEGRTLIKLSSNNGYVITELQLGVQ